MSNLIEETRTFDLNADAVFVCCTNALESMKFGIKEHNIALGVIKASKMTFSSIIRIELDINPIAAKQTSVRLKSFPLNVFGRKALFGNGKAARQRASEFWALLDKIIDRVRIQYD